MEELGHEELQRGVEEERDAEHRPDPCVAGPEPGQQEHGNRAEGGDADLGDVEQVRPRAQPVKGDEEVVAGRGVVAEHLEPPDGQEAAEVRQEPDALVVDAHVEVDRGEAVVLQNDEDREDRAQPTIASPSTISGPRSASRRGRSPRRAAPVAPSSRMVRAGHRRVVVPVVVPADLAHGVHGRRARVASVGGHFAGSIDGLMGLFNKILHAGEGRKLKSLESIPPIVGRSSPRWSDAPTTSCARSRATSASGSTRHRRRRQERAPRRPPPRGVRRGPRGGQAHARPAALRRADHGRGRAALRLGRRDEDR